MRLAAQDGQAASAGGDGHVEAECFQLADVAADLAVGVGVLRVVVGAEVAVAGFGVLEQVPDDNEDGPADSDVGFPPPAPAGPGGEAAVPFAEERGGAGGPVGGQRAQAVVFSMSAWISSLT